jgi:hypothetical protein
LRSEWGYRLAVMGVGLALVAFAIASGVILASGHDPTQAFWTVVTGLAGALVGILAPTPSVAKAGPAGPDAIHAHVAAAAAARQVAQARSTQAAQAAAVNDVAAAAAASRDADLAASAADGHAAKAKPGRVPLSLSVAVLLAIAIACELMLLFFHPEHLTPDLSKQLQAFAAAAAGAAIGLLAPSPATR